MRVLPVDPRSPEPAVVAEAARVLKAGGLVAFPTETVYGLGARALDPAAVAKVFAAKGRPSGHPLIVHVEGEEDARPLAAEWSEEVSRLARTFWPGPLTLVVPRSERVPSAVTGGGDSVALRAPAHPVARALIAAVGAPLAAPSANPYQTLSPTTAAHVMKGLAGRVDLVLDGGPCTAGIESTVLDLCTKPPRVLRPGALDLATLRRALPDVALGVATIAGEGTRASPGMDAKHYAPRARLVVVEGSLAARARAEEEGATGARVGLVLRGDVPSFGRDPKTAHTVALADEPSAYARDLFATLHALDDAGCTVTVIQAVPEDEAWWAVADRLRRASSG